jgi:hypothetical protein
VSSPSFALRLRNLIRRPALTCRTRSHLTPPTAPSLPVRSLAPHPARLSLWGTSANAQEADLISDALGDLLDGFVLAVVIPVAIGTIYYGIRLVKELRRAARR